MGDFIRQLKASLHKGFVDKAGVTSGSYKPELLVNSSTQNKTVLSSIQDELRHCEHFFFSVAFITESGLATLKSLFYDLHQRGVTGRIITSTYLYFNQPKVFRELLKIPNVEVRLTKKEGFHSKGYIFQQADQYSLIVGSSNLTAHALQVNYEWNVKLTSHSNGEIVYHFKDQFEEVWSDANVLTETWIAQYEAGYQANAERTMASQVLEHPSAYQTNAIEKALEITPNKMQQAALSKIEAVREKGHDKGLVISATGTGKTYLSAFDVRRVAPKRMLFIVHREQILKKAKEDFKRVLGGIEEDFGLYVGSNRQADKRYVFASIQTLSKPENLAEFDPAAFDYILIDEVHKAGAASYLRVINHFQPKFLLGMTATPERTDDFNIYELFDYNIAYEIRLQEALEEDMLCPFHYFGVTDFEMDGELIGDHTILSKLVTSERVEHIIDKITYYSHAGDKVKGLMFCSRKEEARKLSEELNMRGYKTVALTGDDSNEERMNRVQQLENGELEYILTVDIFNEGIDIPSINQVVMLRQTQSSIIFIQQLGRGLRKYAGKSFVTVIDFIG
ncbi:DEAD/DEAH box helicase family protein, partial [Sporosarcina sp. GW1-11]|uniref:DEAD/DEAH box helicase family protein n=1 Tax=Sporosarcina sp. GW1-11 TaxID=2899126 RepID=UPI00294C022E